MDKDGFTLIELIVVMSIIGILLAVATLGFVDWIRKARIEAQTREFLTDLSFARSESIFRKTRHSIVLNSAATGYAFKRYSSENESRFGGMEIFSKTMKYTFSKQNGNSAADQVFQFDVRGFAATPSDLDTIRVNPVNSGAAFDCVVIATSRLNIGRMEGTSCVQK